ncbi:hypothetical protein JOF29_005874 [Kribbella aluminosa]|uniref:DUF389 domain-containing protein n=1 Tax=Kribbella aluminosa TaxID=416017 RepID=A0ABS4USZ9_9ACTN|nr:hypothetical protein [Kribbella aluminosa]MBP2354764.1 hypothetical protein [Kribbella aluminosa]
MAHVAPTSHRRATRASHRGHRSADGPVQISSWLGLAFGFVVGWILTFQSHVGVHAAGVTLLVMLVPITIGTFVAAFKQGVGSWTAALLTAAGLAFTVLKFFF